MSTWQEGVQLCDPDPFGDYIYTGHDELDKSCISHKTLRAAACLVNRPYTWAAMAGIFGSAEVAEIFGVAFGVALLRPRGHVVATRIVGVAALLPPWKGFGPYWVSLGAGF